MGDRCYLQVTVHPSDVDKFCEIAGLDPDDFTDSPGDPYTSQVEEANYALHDELNEAAAEGCRFTGWHTSGDDYPGMEFVGYAGDYLDCAAVASVGLVVRFDAETGEAYPHSIADARRFVAAAKACESEIRAAIESRT